MKQNLPRKEKKYLDPKVLKNKAVKIISISENFSTSNHYDVFVHVMTEQF